MSGGNLSQTRTNGVTFTQRMSDIRDVLIGYEGLMGRAMRLGSVSHRREEGGGALRGRSDDNGSDSSGN